MIHNVQYLVPYVSFLPFQSQNQIILWDLKCVAVQLKTNFAVFHYRLILNIVQETGIWSFIQIQKPLYIDKSDHGDRMLMLSVNTAYMCIVILTYKRLICAVRSHRFLSSLWCEEPFILRRQEEVYSYRVQRCAEKKLYHNTFTSGSSPSCSSFWFFFGLKASVLSIF